MYKVLIPDSLGPQVISGIRGLSPNRISVATKKSKLTPFLKSKYIENIFDIAKPNEDEEMFVAQLEKLIAHDNYDLVLPFGLDSYYVCAKYQNIIHGKSNAFLPEYSRLEIANDKERCLKICNESGIDCPENYEAKSQGDLKSIAKEVRFPVVIKARSGTGTEKGLRYANNYDELLYKYEEIESNVSAGALNYKSPIVQEFIPGYIHDACTLSLNGKPLNVLTQIRALMYPVYGGVGAINITTDDKELRKLAMKTIEIINWNGPAQIEFKLDPRDGKYKLIEINPKLWGTLDLSIKAGMNFPRLILDYVTEKKTYEYLRYKTNIMYVFKYPQEMYAKKQLKGIKRMELYPKTSSFTDRYTDFDFSDPIPDVTRILSSYKNMMLGKINNNTANIDIDLIFG